MGTKILNNFLKMIGIDNNNEENIDDQNESYYDENEGYDEDEAYVDDEMEEDYVPQKNNGRSFSQIQSNPYSSRNIHTKVIPMNNSLNSASKMVITQPSCFEDVQEISEYVKAKKSLIINLENVSKEDARRIIDFLSGATMIIEGTIQKVSNLIYLMTPKNVEVQNDLERSQYKQQKVSLSWLK